MKLFLVLFICQIYEFNGFFFFFFFTWHIWSRWPYEGMGLRNSVRQMLPRILDTAEKKEKGVRNTIKNRNSTWPITWCSLHPRGSIFLFGRGVIFLGFWCSQCVPTMLPQVLNLFLKMFPIASNFMP
jgi:hypothetical protein